MRKIFLVLQDFAEVATISAPRSISKQNCPRALPEIENLLQF